MQNYLGLEKLIEGYDAQEQRIKNSRRESRKGCHLESRDDELTSAVSLMIAEADQNRHTRNVMECIAEAALLLQAINYDDDAIPFVKLIAEFQQGITRGRDVSYLMKKCWALKGQAQAKRAAALRQDRS